MPWRPGVRYTAKVETEPRSCAAFAMCDGTETWRFESDSCDPETVLGPRLSLVAGKGANTALDKSRGPDYPSSLTFAYVWQTFVVAAAKCPY